MTEVNKALYSSYMANCAFNAFLSYTAITLNSVTIHAIRKTSSLPKPLKTLLLSLAVSDLGVGLIVQPLYIALLVTEYSPSYRNMSLYIVYVSLMNLLSFASFFGVTAITVDRFLAIHLHLRYQELVTHKRVVAVVISIWLLSASLSLTGLLAPARKDKYIVFAAIDVSCLITTALLYCKIYLAVRHHANQIHALQVQLDAQNGEMVNAARLRKSAIGTFYVYLVFLVCYLPTICFYFVAFNSGWSTNVKILASYSATLVFLNSSLNPLIYCWKMRQIQHTVMDIMRKIVPWKESGSLVQFIAATCETN